MTATVVCTSDLHGELPVIPPCDLLLIAGDVCPVRDHRLGRQKRWLDTTFRRWLEQVRANKIVGTWGNHDFVAQEGLVPDDLPGTWLEHGATTWKGLTIFGSAWTPPFMDWAFMAPEDKLEVLYEDVPDDTSILLTHGPPLGLLDRVDSRHVGSAALYKKMNELQDLQLHTFGHIHEGYGQRGFLVNASHVNERYKPINPPIVRTVTVKEDSDDTDN